MVDKLTSPKSPAADRVKNGQVFTPPFLANWAASLVAEGVPTDRRLTVLDPACGHGELLIAAQSHLPHVDLYGIEVDPSVATVAAKRLRPLTPHVLNHDMLSPAAIDLFSGPNQPDVIIANPPWGRHITRTKVQLRSAGFSLAIGQFDNWDLFIELSIRLLKPGGIGVFIIPDAIFAPEHTRTRKLLTSECTLDLIARLGEGIFKEVYRGTTVLRFRKTTAATDHKVEVFRPSKLQRMAILQGQEDLNGVRRTRTTVRPQSVFRYDATTRWDIDVASSDNPTIMKIERQAGSWVDELYCGRGIEISKSGFVRVCLNCGLSIPAPSRPREVICRGCGVVQPSESMSLRQITEPLNGKPQLGHLPFVVGEDVRRYGLSCSRSILLKVPGINYKPLTMYSGERLLVRKTGVGLKATLTDAAVATNQVVYHYRLRRNRFRGLDFLGFVLGVFCSRTLFAYHLKKAGEREWRSHPYVTPTSLKRLPIPVPVAGTAKWRQAEAIAEGARRLAAKGGLDMALDFRVERLVAGLYELGEADLAWVKRVIEQAQPLEPMRALGGFDLSDVYPVEVG